MFLQVCVILFTGQCLPQCMLGYHHPLGADTPREQTQPPSQRADTPPPEQTSPGSRHIPEEQTSPKSRHPPRADAPRVDIHPQEQTPPKSRHPPQEQTPPPGRRLRYRSISSLYASCWNAFLFVIKITVSYMNFILYQVSRM